MITQDQIRELRELHAKGTEGPWVVNWGVILAHGIDTTVAEVPEGEDYRGDKWEANKVKIVALHNATPDLLDAAEEAIRLRELVKVMRKALEIANRGIDADMWPHTKSQVSDALALASKEVAS